MTKRQLTTALKLMRETHRHIRPDGAWVLRTRHELLKTIRRDAYRHPVISTRERLKTLILAFIPRTAVETIRGPVMAVLSVIGMVLGGSLASVSAAERSVPGDILYPVKLAAEQARLLMETEQPKKLQLKTEFVGRRAEEVKKIAKITNTAKRSERIKEAADIMKKDLDTIKTELHAVAASETAAKAVEAAKGIDKMGDQVAQAVKEVKDLVPDDAKAEVIEVQAAAVTASIRAVQVMIEKREDPTAQQVISSDDLKRSVSEKVQGLEEGIAVATKKMADAVQMSSESVASQPMPRLTAATTTASELLEPFQESINQLKAAQDSIEATKESLEKEDLQQVKDRLGEAIKAINAAEKGIAAVVPETRVTESATSTVLTPSSIPASSSTSSASSSRATTTAQEVSSSTSAVADGR